MSSMKLRAAALLSIAALSLTACGSATDTVSEAKAGDSKTVITPTTKARRRSRFREVCRSHRQPHLRNPGSVWGVKLTAGAVTLMPDTISYTKVEKMLDLGSHKEPNLESVVTVDPDLIINGQRYTQHAAKFKELAPKPPSFPWTRAKASHSTPNSKNSQVTTLGEIFGKQAEAEKLVEDFEAAEKRVH